MRHRSIIALILLAAFFFFPGRAFAWSQHALGIYRALLAMPGVNDAPAIPAESLESFLAAESEGIAKILDESEAWAVENVPTYPARPEALRFDPGGEDGAQVSPAELRKRFLAAIRVNPNMVLDLYVQLVPGQDCGARPRLSYDTRSVFDKHDAQFLRGTIYCGLRDGENVKPIHVVTTGGDEPDLGLDIGVWEDNDTDFGKTYGFGRQSFGNPAFPYSSQAPFHIGFYHESWVLYLAASNFKRSYPEYRIQLYGALAKHAFATGHDYWGWRFTGWGMHYLTDLTQPYHSTVVPGYSTAYLVWISLMNMIGFSQSYNDTVNLVSNRHTALESFQMQMMRRAYRLNQDDNPVFVALADTGADDEYKPYNNRTPRDVVSLEAYNRATRTDAALQKWMPARLVEDPSFDFAQHPDEDVYEDVLKDRKEGISELNQLLAEIFRSFGAYTRHYVRHIQSGARNTNYK